jgi:YesN/AraC family two-component response regulator
LEESGRQELSKIELKTTGNTPVEYLKRVKIEAAKKSLENHANNVNEVMYDAGYSDAKAFRKVFRKIKEYKVDTIKTVLN